MGIEYFVEGQVKLQTGGNHIVKSKGVVSNNAVESVAQKGAETGVSYNNADEVHDADKPVNSIDVTLNLFFDGTGNNKSNTEARKANSIHYQEEGNKKNDSFENEFSNVAKGYDAIDSDAENQVAEYIEGIGTVDLQGDNLFPGQALGSGETGVVGKVTKGCMKGADKVGNFIKKSSIKNINTLKVNVYGFSRGAAAARHFVHVAGTPPSVSYSNGRSVLQIFPPKNIPDASFVLTDDDGTKLDFINQYGYFGACLMKKGLAVKKIVVNFVGLYDTVASYGVLHKNDTSDLGLDSISRAYFVLQLASDNEYRKNFRLTNINSAALHGLEFTLPGVHSDIGGAYRNGNEERDDRFRYETKKLFTSKNRLECERFRELLISEGWYNSEEISIKAGPKSMSPGKRHLTSSYTVTGKRVLSNHYDKIPLNMMFHYSKQFQVKYMEDVISRMHAVTGDTLSTSYSQLLGYMNACNQKRNDYVEGRTVGNYIEDIKNIRYEDYIEEESLKRLRNQYLHWSVEYGDLFVNGENVSGALPVSQRKRTIQHG